MYKRKSDNMWCQKIREGNRYRVIYGTTQKELREKLRYYSPVASRSFRSVALDWFDVHSEKIGPVSARMYKSAMNRAVDYFGDMRIAEIRPIDVQRYLNHVVDSLDLSAKTAQNHLIVLNLILRYAVMSGYMEANPASEIRIDSNLRRSRRMLPDPEDLVRIKENAGHPFGLFPMIALYTGLRRGEILALTKEDIDINARLIYVRRALLLNRERVSVKAPKTEAGIRVVGIPDVLLPYLQDLPEGLLFHKNGRPLNEHQYCLRWSHYCADTGVSCTAHQLRHAYTTALIESGLPPEEVQRLVGHADIATTINVYTHLKEARARSIASKTFGLDPAL